MNDKSFSDNLKEEKITKSDRINWNELLKIYKIF